MITANTTAHTATPQLEALRDKDVQVDVTDPTGQLCRESLLTVLNRLSAIGYDRWSVRVRLSIGEEIATDLKWKFRCIPEHQHRPWQPSPCFATPNAEVPKLPVDDVKQAYDVLISLLERPRQIAALEILLSNLVSRLKNHAAVQTLRAGKWAEEALDTEDAGDAERSGLFEGQAGALSWVGDELIALQGKAIKARHLALRPFGFPEAWRKDPPSAEDLRPLTPEEQEASDGFDQAKREREEGAQS